MSFSSSPYGVIANQQQPNVLRGVLAGAGAAALGAVAWTVIAGATHRQFAFLALILGYGVGYAMVRFGDVAHPNAVVTAACIALAGVLVGHFASVYVVAMHSLDSELGEAIKTLPPMDILFDLSITTAMSWLFFILAPAGAIRLVLAGRSAKPGPHTPNVYAAPPANAASWPPSAPANPAGQFQPAPGAPAAGAPSYPPQTSPQTYSPQNFPPPADHPDAR